MRRREVITLLGGAAAWPLAARAQQSEPIRLIGILAGFAEAEMQPRLAALRGKLRELGWTEGHNLSIDVRVGRGDFNRIRDDAGLLVGLKPDVIITNGTPALTAVRERSRTIPVVFVLVADPVRQFEEAIAGFLETVGDGTLMFEPPSFADEGLAAHFDPLGRGGVGHCRCNRGR